MDKVECQFSFFWLLHLRRVTKNDFNNKKSTNHQSRKIGTGQPINNHPINNN